MTTETPPSSSPTGPSSPSGRPIDVGTAFGLWLAALPLLVVGQAVDTALGPAVGARFLVYAMTGLLLFLVSSVVVVFLFLLRQGYRWARTVLTGGGVASVVYVVTSLFTINRGTVAALVYAVTAIVGSVFILGGAYLLHRKDAQAFFTR